MEETKTTNTQLTISTQFLQNAEYADIVDKQIQGLEINKHTGLKKDFMQVAAVGLLRSFFDLPGIMDGVMALQNTKLGFLTDSKTGYQPEVVKDCCAEALMYGLQLIGNQFNILASKMYPTKEGFEHLLQTKVDGLLYNIEQSLPYKKGEETVVDNQLAWEHLGEKHTKTLTTAVVNNSGMKTDALLGKAMRKACKYIYNRCTGNNLSDGNAQEADFEVIGSKPLETKTPAPSTTTTETKVGEEIEFTLDDTPSGAIPTTEEELKQLRIENKVEWERADGHLMKAEDIVGLDKRLAQILVKHPKYDKKGYNERKEQLTKTTTN